MAGEPQSLQPEGEEQPADPLAENLGDTGAPALRNEGDTSAPLVPLDPAPEAQEESIPAVIPVESRLSRILNRAKNSYNQINIRDNIRKLYDTKVKKIVLGSVAGAAILAGGIYGISKLAGTEKEQTQPENKLANKYIEASTTKAIHTKTPAAYQSIAGIMDFYAEAKGQKLSDLEKFLFASTANPDGEELTEQNVADYKKLWAPGYDNAKPSSEVKAGFGNKSPVYVFESKEQADKLDSIVERHAKAKQETLKREGRNIEVKYNDAWKLWCRDYAANKFGAGKISGTDQDGNEVKDATYISNSAIESYDKFIKGVESALGGK
jgi:hypothetical protein